MGGVRLSRRLEMRRDASARHQAGRIRYQSDGPWLMDASAYTGTVGDAATDLDTAVAETATWLAGGRPVRWAG